MDRLLDITFVSVLFKRDSVNVCLWGRTKGPEEDPGVTPPGTGVLVHTSSSYRFPVGTLPNVSFPSVPGPSPDKHTDVGFQGWDKDGTHTVGTSEGVEPRTTHTTPLGHPTPLPSGPSRFGHGGQTAVFCRYGEDGSGVGVGEDYEAGFPWRDRTDTGMGEGEGNVYSESN